MSKFCEIFVFGSVEINLSCSSTQKSLVKQLLLCYCFNLFLGNLTEIFKPGLSERRVIFAHTENDNHPTVSNNVTYPKVEPREGFTGTGNRG